MNEELKKKLHDMIHSKKVYLFMKGTPLFPQCGFSAKVAGVLQHLNVDFGSFNVLEDEIVWEGIKEYADWPTIPQLFIDGKLIGGCDITLQMAEKGELRKLLGE